MENREHVRCLIVGSGPAGYTAAVPEPARKRAIGNGWTASVIAEIFKLLPQAETVAKTDVA